MVMQLCAPEHAKHIWRISIAVYIYPIVDAIAGVLVVALFYLEK